jgi:(2S)-methylsuccinyl-CoA dehydrogenase
MLDGITGQLHRLCTRAGKVVPGLLDDNQQLAYDLALAHADLEAIHAMLGIADEEAAPDLTLDTAVAFAADSLQSILQRLFRSAGQAVRDDLLAFQQRPEIQDLFSVGLSPSLQASIGARLADQQISLLLPALDEDKRLMRDSFGRFAREQVAPLAEAIHREDKDIPDALLKQAAAMGCFGTCIPARFGGLQPDEQADSLSMIVVTEELSRASLGAAGSLVTRPEIAARALLAGGSKQQQAHWLPKLASGETLCAIAITEPDTGSDVASVTLKATSTDGGWLLNGSKTWCTFAGRSELLVVLARSESFPGHKGLSLFLAEKPAFAGHQFEHVQNGGGSLTGKAIATLGYRGMHSYTLFFNDFFVPAANLLGEEPGRGKGFYYTMAGFAGGRIQTAARANGVMQAAFEKSLDYATDRKTFGKPLADYQLTQIKLYRMLATITACRLFSYRVAALLDSGAGQMQASLVKLFACRAAEWVTREAMQLHGGMGYAEESAVSRYFVDARVLSIFEGAEEVLAIKVVARELIERAGQTPVAENN